VEGIENSKDGVYRNEKENFIFALCRFSFMWRAGAKTA